ncbi:MAG: DUF6090 family protein [Bacteroidota bacterium]
MKYKVNWRYVVGEILIVTVGILIAFGINTLSSNLALRKNYKEFRLGLVTDLEQNIQNLERIITAQERKVKELNVLIDNSTKRNIALDSIGAILFRQRKSPTFFPISGTFKSLVSHGEIALFETDLKRELFNLYDTNYERIVYNGNLYDNLYVEVYDQEIRDMMNIRTKEIDDVSRLTSRDFLKNMMLVVDEAESYLTLLRKNLLESQKILAMIHTKET